MRKIVVSLALLTLAVPVTAQQHNHGGDDDHAAMHEGVQIAEGWQVRTDRDAPLDGIHFMSMGNRLHAITGPAGVFYNEDWQRSGEYEVSATLTQRKSPEHPESYGIVIGGTNLDGADQAYSYFLVRKTGEYFIATRQGDERTVVVNWTSHPAINAEGDDGQQTNELSARVAGGEVIFSVNGTEVTRIERAELETDGIFGFRVNHRLDVMIEPN